MAAVEPLATAVGSPAIIALPPVLVAPPVIALPPMPPPPVFVIESEIARSPSSLRDGAENTVLSTIVEIGGGEGGRVGDTGGI